MMNFLFPSFLKDPREYEQAQRFWQSHWQELLNGAGQKNLWESPWLNTKLADGSPYRDGNPIFSAINRKNRLGVRVIQLQPGNEPSEISHWTDKFGQGPEVIKELVISCALSEKTLHQALALMKQWLAQKEGHGSSSAKRRPISKKALGDKS